MDRDVFISHATGDAESAAAVCRSLEANGLKCWMAPRDILPGTDYSAALAHAIPRCRALVLLLSRCANDSQWVHREVERAVTRGKPVLTVRLEKVAPAERLELFVSSTQWFDVFGVKPTIYLSELGKKVQLLLRENPPAAPAPPDTPPRQAAANAAGAEPRRRDDAGELPLPSRQRRGSAAPAPPAVPDGERVAGPPAAKPRRTRTWLAAGGGAVALVAGAIALLILITPPGPAEQPGPASEAGTPVAEPSKTSPGELKARFDRLVFRFEESVLQEQCSLAAPEYLELCALATSAPAAEGGWMHQELDRLTSQCQAMERHDERSREVLSELRGKHQLNGP